MAFVVEDDETPSPIDVGLFGADGIMFDAQDIAELIEQFFRWSLHRLPVDFAAENLYTRTKDYGVNGAGR
jgi:hypothetical protein